MLNSIKIVSDGTAWGTKVYTAEGHEIRGIKRLAIEPLVPGEMVRATIDFIAVSLDMKAAMEADLQQLQDAGKPPYERGGPEIMDRAELQRRQDALVAEGRAINGGRP